MSRLHQRALGKTLLAPLAFVLLWGGAANAQEIKGSLIDISGAKIWCLDSGGEGKVVTFLHPNTGTSEIFRPQFPTFIAAGFRTLACDRRTSGRSEVAEKDFKAGSVAQDTIAVMDALNIETTHLLGVAGGGFAALDFAVHFPERTDSLIVGGSNGRVRDDEIQEFRAALQIPGVADLPTHAYRELSSTYRGTNLDGVAKWVAIENSAHTHGSGSQAEMTPNTYEKISGIDVPTLTIAGGADLIAPPALMALWTAHIPGARIETIAEVGHAVSWEKPHLFNGIALEFLTNLPR